MGLGLSSNANAGDAPRPYRLWDLEPGLFDYLEYSAPLSIDEARREASLFEEMWTRREQVPLLLHPVHLNLYGPRFEAAEALRALDAHAQAVGSPWVSNDVAWWHVEGEPFPGYLYVAPPLSDPGVADCAAHALHVQAELHVPLLLENPVVIERRGPLHVLDFMAKLHARTGLGLLLDVGHLYSHQLARGFEATGGLDGFPWEAVAEVHVAGGEVATWGARRYYVDDHRRPMLPAVRELLSEVLARTRNLRALTLEGDGWSDEQAGEMLRELRRELPKPSGRTQFDPRPRVGSPKLETDPQALLAALYGSGATSEDPEGRGAERALRLRVLAEALDRRWPITRLLLLADPAEAARFAASAEFQSVFAEGNRTVSIAFAAWARRRLRECPDPAASIALAYETWRGERERGRFPVDLSAVEAALPKGRPLWPSAEQLAPLRRALEAAR